MRQLFLFLFLVNVTFFALMQPESLGWGEKANQVQLPLHPELIRLRDISKLETPAPQSVLKLKQDLNPLSQPAQEPSLEAIIAQQPEPEKTFCVEWGEFSGEDLKRVNLAFSELQLDDKLGQREIEQDTGYWVYIPPLKNKAMVKKKIDELRELGISEYYVVSNTGRWKNSISLGVFKTPEAAQNLFNQLRDKGVRSAKMGERASKLITTQFILSGIGSKTRDKLIELQKDFKGSELKEVPCTLTR